MALDIKLYETPFNVYGATPEQRQREYFRVEHKETGNWASFGIGGGCFVAHGFLKGQTTVGVHVSGHIIDDNGKMKLEALFLGHQPISARNWQRLADKVDEQIQNLPPPSKSLFSDVSVPIRSWPVVFAFLRTLDGTMDKKALPFKLMDY